MTALEVGVAQDDAVLREAKLGQAEGEGKEQEAAFLNGLFWGGMCFTGLE